MKKKIAIVLISIIILLCACGSDESNIFDKVMGVTDASKVIKILGEPDSETAHRTQMVYYYIPFLGRTGRLWINIKNGKIIYYYLTIKFTEPLEENGYSEYGEQCVDYFTEKYGPTEREAANVIGESDGWTYTWNMSDESSFVVTAIPESASVNVGYTP